MNQETSPLVSLMSSHNRYYRFAALAEGLDAGHEHPANGAYIGVSTKINGISLNIVLVGHKPNGATEKKTLIGDDKKVLTGWKTLSIFLSPKQSYHYRPVIAAMIGPLAPTMAMALQDVAEKHELSLTTPFAEIVGAILEEYDALDFSKFKIELQSHLGKKKPAPDTPDPGSEEEGGEEDDD